MKLNAHQKLVIKLTNSDVINPPYIFQHGTNADWEPFAKQYLLQNNLRSLIFHSLPANLGNNFEQLKTLFTYDPTTNRFRT